MLTSADVNDDAVLLELPLSRTNRRGRTGTRTPDLCCVNSYLPDPGGFM